MVWKLSIYYWTANSYSFREKTLSDINLISMSTIQMNNRIVKASEKDGRVEDCFLYSNAISVIWFENVDSWTFIIEIPSNFWWSYFNWDLNLHFTFYILQKSHKTYFQCWKCHCLSITLRHESEAIWQGCLFSDFVLMWKTANSRKEQLLLLK